jgi:hypothetical protein
MSRLDGAILGLKIVVNPGYRDAGELMQLNLIDAVFLHYCIQ